MREREKKKESERWEREWDFTVTTLIFYCFNKMRERERRESKREWSSLKNLLMYNERDRKKRW